MPAAAPDARDRVLLFLTLLTSDALQERLGRRLPPERLAFALCRLWVDEIYRPGWRYVDGVKGDRSAAEAARFLAAFTADERPHLERFHHFLELRLEMLPEADRRRGAFSRPDAWAQLVRDAGYLLERLEGDAGRLRDRIAALAAADEPAAALYAWLAGDAP